MMHQQQPSTARTTPTTPSFGSPLARDPLALGSPLGPFALLADAPPTSLRLYTLGDFQARLPLAAGGRAPVWSNPLVTRALKCLAAAPGHQLAADTLVEHLWPDCPATWGRARLHDTLSKLRSALEPNGLPYRRVSYLVKNGETVRLVVRRPGEEGAGVWLDADVFERLAEAALAASEWGPEAQALADRALALYRGHFLPMDLCEDWSRAARERYQRLWATLLGRSAWMALRMRRFDEALLLLGRRTDEAPDDEEAVCLSMLALVGAWRRREAERLYQGLRAHQWEAREQEPSPELQALNTAIRAGASVDDLLARFL